MAKESYEDILLNEMSITYFNDFSYSLNVTSKKRILKYTFKNCIIENDCISSILKWSEEWSEENN